MRAAALTFAIGAVVACSGEPFTAETHSANGPVQAGSGGGAAAGAPLVPSINGGTAAMGGAPDRSRAGAAGMTAREPESEPGGAGGASGGAPAGGEGGASPEPRCPSRATGDWELGYFPELREHTTQESHPFFQATNRGQTTTLDRIVIRYYFTNDSGLTETATCFWVTGDRCALAKLAFGDVPAPTANASRYLEVSFPSASNVKVMPGKLEVRVGFKTGSAPDLQTNDYSFDPNAATPSSAMPFPYKRWLQATLYVDGELVWGAEPCALGRPTTDAAPESP